MNGGRYANWGTGVCLGIGLLVVLNQLQIPYYLFYPRTTSTILISSFYDYSLFLVSSISVPLTFALYRKRFPTAVSLGTLAAWAVSFVLAIINEPLAVAILYATVICAASLWTLRSDARRSTFNEILTSALTIFALVEWSSVCYWVAVGINPHGDLAGVLSQELEANLTFFLYPVAIQLMLLLLFSCLWVPLIAHLLKPKAHLIVRYQPSPKKPDSRTVVAGLDLLAIIAIIIFFYPYLEGQSWIVGQDTYWRYIGPVNGLIGLTPAQAVNTSASHGLYVLFLYLIQLGTGLSPAIFVKYAPLALAFGTASAVLFATLRGSWSFQLAILSSTCTLLWLPTTIGIYVAIQANWLALCFWMLFLGIYFSKSETKVTYVILAILSLAILFIHPWTWGVFATTLLFSAITSRRSVWGQHSVRTLAAALTLAIPLGAVAYSLFPSLREDLTNTIQLYVSGPIDPASLLRFGDALANTFYNLGPALSPTLLLLCLLGTYALARRRDIAANYLIAWTAAWCIGSILVAPTGLNPTNPGLNETGLWRMLYISPLPFLLALGLDKSLSFSRQLVPPTNTSRIAQFGPSFSVLPFLASGTALFWFLDANVRLILVAAALVVALLLLVRFPNGRLSRVLLMTVLVLLLFNAAFRTLFPLALDPHNIFSSAGGAPGPGR